MIEQQGEAPLAGLIPVFVDVETYMDDGVSLKSMTLRQYLKASHLLMMAVSVGFDDEPEVFYTVDYPGPPGSSMIGAALVQTLHKLARDPRYVFVAHNAAFDMRVLTLYLDIPHPINVWCTLEGSMGSWPEFPDGYKLANISAKLLPKGQGKFEVDLKEFEAARKKAIKKHFLGRRDVPTSVWESVATITKAAKIPWDGEVLTLEIIAQVVAAYNIRDVVAMREIYKLQIPRLCAREQLVALRTHHQRRHFFHVDQARLRELTDQLDLATTEAAAHAGEYLTEDQLREVFNRRDGSLQSVRAARLKNVLNASGTGVPVPRPKAKSKDIVSHNADDIEFFAGGRRAEIELVMEEFESTSLKKISPLQMARNPNAAAVLAQTSRANKMLSHKRRSGVFRGVDIVDTELGYARATTLRFSSPSCGRGLNLHNCVSVYSLILTDRGWVPITALNKEDLLWDGEEFVAYDQVTLEGQRSTMKVGPVELTPEHPVWTSEQRVAASELTLSQQVQCVAVGLSSTLRGLLAARAPFDATDAAQKLYASFSRSTSLWAAVDALTAAHRATSPSSTQQTQCSSSGAGSTTCVTALPLSPTCPSSPSSMGQTLELACALSGWRPLKPTTATSQHFLAGTISLCKLIASTTNSATNPETCDSLLRALTSATEEILSAYQPERRSQITVVGSGLNISPGTKCSAQAVFDIRGVGPRARFVTNGIVTFNCPKHDVTIAKPVRKLFRLPGHLCFVRGDLANVECRVESLLTGARVGIDMFDGARGGDLNADPYIMTWKAMVGALIKNKKDPFRQVAKCLAAGSPVLTQRGFVVIEDVSVDDSVWDGTHWVSHSGVVAAGVKDTVCVDGVWMSLDHPVLTSNGWMEACQLLLKHPTRSKVTPTAPGTCSGPSSGERCSLKQVRSAGTASSNAGTGRRARRASSTLGLSKRGRRQAARPPGFATVTYTASRRSSPTSSCEPAGSTGTMRLNSAASSPATQNTKTMEAEASSYVTSGWRPQGRSSPISKDSLTGTPRGVNAIGSTTTVTMPPGTSRLAHGLATRSTPGQLDGSSTTANDCVRLSSGASMLRGMPVRRSYSEKPAKAKQRIKSLLARQGVEVRTEPTYDVTNAGPNHCFQVAGLIVHNSAVLGLGFAMSATGYAKVLLNTLADKKSGVTEKTLRDLIVTNRWNLPEGDGVTNVIRALGCSQVVALAAYSIQRIFNETFPEYTKTAGWLVGVASDCARFGPGQIGVDDCNRMIDTAYRMPAAPKRDLINLTAFNDGLNDFSSLRVGCGYWPGTLTWREPKNRVIDFGDRRQALTIRKASGELKPFTRQLAIENVTQAAARNAMCMGVEKLESLGFKDVLHVHDEVLIIAERNRASVLAARQALVDAFGPSHGMPWGWSILVKPDEITVTESLYEDEDDIAVTVSRKDESGNVILGPDGKPAKFPGPDRWGKIERDEVGCLANLP